MFGVWGTAAASWLGNRVFGGGGGNNGPDIDAFQEELEEAQQAYENQSFEAVDSDGDGLVDRVVDQDGNVIHDFSHVEEQMEGALEQGQEIPTMHEWMQQHGYEFQDYTESEPYQNLDELMGQLEDPESDLYDRAGEEAFEYAASTIGMNPAEYEQFLADLRREASMNVDEMPGFSEEGAAARERALQADMRVAEERAERMIESIRANSGSSTRAYMMADQAVRQINDYEIQRRAAIAQEELRVKMTNLQSKQQMYELMMQRGQVSQAQFLENYMNGVATAFQGYATQINTIVQENQQYFQMYQADMAALQQQVQNLYQAIHTELGYNQQVLDTVMDQYGLALAEYQTELNNIATNFQMEAVEYSIEEQQRGQLIGNIFGGLQIIAGVAITAFSGGALAPIGVPLIGSGLGTVAASNNANVSIPQMPQSAYNNVSFGGGGGATPQSGGVPAGSSNDYSWVSDYYNQPSPSSGPYI